MFLDKSILKRLMKQAYKDRNGLRVAMNADSLYMCGGYWETEIKLAFLTKEIKAQIIELAGELPELGETYSATKEGNQMEEGVRRTVEIDNRMNEGMKITDFYMDIHGRMCRIIQDDVGNTYTINRTYIDIIDNGAIDEDKGEYSASGYLDKSHTSINYMNNACKFRAYLIKDAERKDVLEKLALVDLMELSV